MTPVIDNPPQGLDQIVEFAFPDALMVEYQRHAEDTYTVSILNLDYRYTVWLGSLSLDHRWTLSPRLGPWQGKPIEIEGGMP